MDMSGQIDALSSLAPGKELSPSSKRLGGPQSQFRYFGEEKNVLYLP
jgi:hypothetical protein